MEASDEIRLNKYLCEAGVCSRREADRLIEAGQVTVDGETASLGMKIVPTAHVVCNGKAVGGKPTPVLLAVNKPQGITCTCANAKVDKDNIVDFLQYPDRIYPVGRLDKDSEGLVLMTNQGDLVNKILRSSNFHEKEYLVRVNKPLTPEFLQAMGSGVPILDTVTRPCKVEQLDKYKFRIILTQGLNRQIRRMCEHLGFRVNYLQRVRVLNIKLGSLKSGSWRKIEGAELKELLSLLKDSSDLPYKQRSKS